MVRSGGRRRVTRESCGSHGFRDDAKDHSQLIDDHLCGLQVIHPAKHVRTTEFVPLHLVQVETPDYGHLGQIFRKGEIGYWVRDKEVLNVLFAPVHPKSI